MRKRFATLVIVSVYLLMLTAIVVSCNREAPSTPAQRIAESPSRSSEISPDPIGSAPIAPDPVPSPEIFPPVEQSVLLDTRGLERVEPATSTRPRLAPVTARSFAAAGSGVAEHDLADWGPGCALCPAPQRSGIAFPLSYDQTRFRVNLQLLSNYFVPDQLWRDAKFRAALHESGGEFPVRMWRGRAGKFEMIEQITIPAAPGVFRQYGIRGDRWQRGDVVVIEFTPGLFVVDQQLHGQRAVIVPFASVVDNRSNDPVTLYGTMVRF
jgi:hypothetical protein